MTIDSWLKIHISQLKNAGVETSRLDCLVLLSDVTQHDKSWVLAHPEHELQIEQINILNTFFVQRATHTPLAYVRGKSEFYGREFVINKHVLVPRPESEDIIVLLKEIAIPSIPSTICDIGTGSGALAITAKLELENSTVIATDIDAACLNVAKTNAARLHANITFLQGDLLQPVHALKIDDQRLIVIANLPYVPLDYPVNLAATHEPKLALYSGDDGLDHYRRLFAEISSLPVLYTIVESLPTQHEVLTIIAEGHGFELRTTRGLIQLFMSKKNLD